MKKIISLLGVFILLISVLVGCGSNTNEVKEELRGTWTYEHYAAATGETCYQVYKFNGDGTVEYGWLNETTPSKSSYHEGTYEVKGKKVVIKYNDDSDANIIEYSYNNGNLKLFDKGSDGTLENELKKE